MRETAKNKYDNPIQPTINFPPTVFGKASRLFQKSGMSIFDFACRFFINSPEPSFSSVGGFRDWKHATGQKGMLTTHSNGKCHTQAMASWKEYETRVTMGESIGCQFDCMGSKVIHDNKKYVLIIMEAVLYCTEQGLSLHGHDESDDSLNLGNFRSLVLDPLLTISQQKRPTYNLILITWSSSVMMEHQLCLVAMQVFTNS